MNPLLQQFLVTVFRWGLTLLAGLSVKLGIFKDLGETEQYIAAGALALSVLAFSMWGKYKSRLKFMVALHSEVGTTENEVIAKIKSGEPIPTVLTPPNNVPGVPVTPPKP